MHMRPKKPYSPLKKGCHIAAALLLSVCIMPCNAFASGVSTVNIVDEETGEVTEAPISIQQQPDSDTQGTQDQTPLPAQYHLTNLGYVTPAKVQSPWGTCWAFATVAAIESSILKAQAVLEAQADAAIEDAAAAEASGAPSAADDGVDADTSVESTMAAEEAAADMSEPRLTGLTETVDLSERAIGWFAHEPQSEDTAPGQAGEGFSQPDGVGPLTQFEGGNFAIAAAALAARQSLVLEDNAPYQYNGYDGTGIPWYSNGSVAGASDDARTRDWSLDAAIRTSQEAGWYVSGVRNISSPAVLDTDFSTGVSEYTGYNPTGTSEIKRSLMEVGAVAVSIQADLSVPSEIAAGQSNYSSEGDTINYGTWSQYNGMSQITLNHAVTIVGWDDSYAVENFGSSQGGTPPSPGAWLCKNNWGSDSFYQALGDPDSSIHWGIRDPQTQEATGFFWVSYYDHSLSGPVAFEVSPIEDDIVYQYDYLGTSEYDAPSTYNGDVKAANVFTSAEVELIDSVCGWTFSPGETVTTWIYALPDENRTSKANATNVHPIAAGTVSALPDSSSGSITTGEEFEQAMAGAQLLAEKSQTFAYAGFHTIELDTPVLTYAGERFAVVQEVETIIANSSGELVPSSYLNLEISFIDSLALQSINSSSSVIANPGETFVSVAGPDRWDSVAEYNEWFADLRQQGNQPLDMVFGNALIKAIGKDTTMDELEIVYELVKLDPAS